MTVAIPDALPDLRSWLRTQPDLQPLHGGRVFFRIPNNPTFPLLRLYRMGGSVLPNSEIPMQDLRISVEVWGGKDGDYPAVRQLVAALESACHEYPPNTVMGVETYVSDMTITNAIDSPDPETGWPRYVVDLSVLALIAGVVPA